MFSMISRACGNPGEGSGLGGQGGCDRRIEKLKSFWENSQKKNFRGGGGGGRFGGGGQGGCE